MIAWEPEQNKINVARRQKILLSVQALQVSNLKVCIERFSNGEKEGNNLPDTKIFGIKSTIPSNFPSPITIPARQCQRMQISGAWINEKSSCTNESILKRVKKVNDISIHLIWYGTPVQYCCVVLGFFVFVLPCGKEESLCPWSLLLTFLPIFKGLHYGWSSFCWRWDCIPGVSTTSFSFIGVTAEQCEVISGFMHPVSTTLPAHADPALEIKS